MLAFKTFEHINYNRLLFLHGLGVLPKIHGEIITKLIKYFDVDISKRINDRNGFIQDYDFDYSPVLTMKHSRYIRGSFSMTLELKIETNIRYNLLVGRMESKYYDSLVFDGYVPNYFSNFVRDASRAILKKKGYEFDYFD